MKNVLFSLLFLGLLGLNAISIQAQCGASKAKAVRTSHTTNVKDVVDIAIGSEVHTTLVAAVQAAGLVETLKSEGPFTVFAPTNSAFDKLPEGTVSTLLKPENKAQLTKILTYHVIPARLDSKAVLGAIKAAPNGKAEVSTVSGGTLFAWLEKGEVYLEDENGNQAKVTAVDLEGSNGVIHVIDQVVLPK